VSFGAWAAEVRYRAACRGNIPQGAASQREAGHSRVSFFKILQGKSKRHGGCRLPDAGYASSARESGSTKRTRSWPASHWSSCGS